MISNIINFIRYDGITGQILATGSCPEQDIELQGENILTGLVANDLTQYVDINTLTLVNIPAKPSDTYEFNFLTKTWEFNKNNALRDIRIKRDILLRESDWTQGADVPDNIKQKWVSYRQALRDITTQNSLENIIWPTPPI